MIPFDEAYEIVMRAREKWREPPLFGNRYRDKHHAIYEIVRGIQPTMIAEIGVRRGYGALFMLAACEDAGYLGIDDDSGTHGGKPGGITQARELLADYDASFFIVDSVQLVSIPLKPDFVRIDGCHTYKGCLNDIALAACTPSAKTIMVDDYTRIPEVRSACDWWSENTSYNSIQEIDHAAESIIWRRT